MSRKLQAEKRLHPRIKLQLPLSVAANGYDFVTTTENLSCLGAYCRIPKYVPPFTKIMIKLSLPISKEKKTSNLQCKGVVVRSEDAPDGTFNIAIFFNAIREEQRKIILKYLDQFLPQESALSAH